MTSAKAPKMYISNVIQLGIIQYLRRFAKGQGFIYDAFMAKMIYLDNASTTPVRPEVILAMKPYWTENFGNPSAITKGGVIARQAVEKARKTIADSLLRRPNEVIFTSGGTESNNLAIIGVVNYLLKQHKIKLSDFHFITTNIEHSSVTECFKELERRGAKVDYLKVKESGIVEVKDLRKLIKPNTILVSVGYANNEIGTVQPIREIAKEIRHARKSLLGKSSPLFHTDASQAGLWLDLNVNQLGVDLMTLDGQKMNGPKGVGVLFKKANLEISPVLFGGGQEKGLRSGTENVPLIVGLAKTFELARKDWIKNNKKVKVVRDYFWQNVQAKIPGVILNGDLEKRLPNNLNISVSNINSEFLVLCLDEAGIVCSTKSSCERDAEESFVVRALGGENWRAKTSLRFSLAENISRKDINYVVTILKKEVQKQKFAFS
jgi:cysteine desulfurase